MERSPGPLSTLAPPSSESGSDDEMEDLEIESVNAMVMPVVGVPKEGAPLPDVLPPMPVAATMGRASERKLLKECYPGVDDGMIALAFQFHKIATEHFGTEEYDPIMALRVLSVRLATQQLNGQIDAHFSEAEQGQDADPRVRENSARDPAAA